MRNLIRCFAALFAILSAIATPAWSYGKEGLTRNRLLINERLSSGERLVSLNGRYQLLFTESTPGYTYRLEEFDRGTRIWSAPAFGTFLAMQGDGNLVLYNDATPPVKAVWATYTFQPGSFLEIQDDGNLVVYSPDNTALWASTVQENANLFNWPETTATSMISEYLFSHRQKLYSYTSTISWDGSSTGQYYVAFDRGTPELGWSRLNGPKLSTDLVLTSASASSGSTACIAGMALTSRQIFTYCTTNPEDPGLWTGPHYLQNEYTSGSLAMAYFSGKFIIMWPTNDAANRIIFSTSSDGKNWTGNKILGADGIANGVLVTIAATPDRVCAAWLLKSLSSPLSFSCATDSDLIWNTPISVPGAFPNRHGFVYEFIAGSVNDNIVLIWPESLTSQTRPMKMAIIKNGIISETGNTNLPPEQLSSIAAIDDRVCLSNWSTSPDVRADEPRAKMPQRPERSRYWTYVYCRPVIPPERFIWMPIAMK